MLLIPEPKQRIKLEAKKQQKQEYKFLFSGKLIPGLKLYEFNPNTGEVKEVVIVKSVVYNPVTEKPLYKKRVIVDTNKWYIQALNFKNAIRKFNKEYEGKIWNK